MSEPHRVFVYGSLMQGLMYHHLLGDSVCVGTAVTQEGFLMISLGPYPAAVDAAGAPVQGELYEVDDRILADLDRLEGVPDLYERRRIALRDQGEAWMYLMAAETVPGGVEHHAPVPDGDWRAWLTGRR